MLEASARLHPTSRPVSAPAVRLQARITNKPNFTLLSRRRVDLKHHQYQRHHCQRLSPSSQTIKQPVDLCCWPHHTPCPSALTINPHTPRPLHPTHLWRGMRWLPPLIPLRKCIGSTFGGRLCHSEKTQGHAQAVAPRALRPTTARHDPLHG